MGAKQARFELFIDIYEKKQQVAQTLTNIPTGELVESILKEFRRDFDFLGQNPDAYCLMKSDGTVLSNNRTLDKQVSNKERLVLAKPCPICLPMANQWPAEFIYANIPLAIVIVCTGNQQSLDASTTNRAMTC